MANFGASERTLARNKVLGFANPAPDTLFQVDLPADDFSRQSAEVCAAEISLSDSEASPTLKTDGDAKRGPPFRDAPMDLLRQSGITTRVKEAELPQSVDDLGLSHLDNKLRKRFRKMLSALAGMWDENLGVIKDAEHRVTLREDAKSFRITPYRTGPAGCTGIRKAGTAMKEDGVIRDAKSEWAILIVLIRKSDGSIRFCVNYRRLNALTVRDLCPLPRMENCLDSLEEAAFFTTLDCNSGYWQITVADEDRAKTAFTCHEGCFEFCRMPFGLCNTPSTFQRTVDMLLSGYRSRTCLVYLDEIIVFSNTAEEHVDHVREVLTVLKEAGFSLKLKKCIFFAKFVDYLGHVIRPGRLEVATQNTEALKCFKEPTTQTELRSFLGLCNVYRRFVPNFARTAAPLNAFLKKGCTTELPPFNEEQSAAFEQLKKALLSPPILRLPRADLPYSVDTDACNHQVGCALLQTYPDGSRHPIEFWSRSLNPTEKHYSVGEKEFLAIFWAVQLLRPYLEGTHFDLYTDHQAMRWILSGSDHSGRLARWRLRLLEFDFTVTYKKGAKNTIADAISSLPTFGEAKLAPDTEVPCYFVSHYEQADSQEPPTDVGGEVSRFLRLSRALSSKKTKKYRALRSK